jgi:hypothetical protein
VTGWWWVLLFGGIAVAALGFFVVVGLQLWGKAKVLLDELARLSAATATFEAAIGPAGADAELPWARGPVAIGPHRSR